MSQLHWLRVLLLTAGLSYVIIRKLLLKFINTSCCRTLYNEVTITVQAVLIFYQLLTLYVEGVTKIVSLASRKTEMHELSGLDILLLSFDVFLLIL